MTVALVEQFYSRIWNKHDLTMIPVLLADDFVFRGSLGVEKHGHAGFAEYVEMVHAALDEYRCDILETVSEPGKVFARMRFSGIHRGELMGCPATGKPVKWDGAALFHMNGARIARLWVLGDLTALRKQLAKPD